ncbi:MAG: hypothetical protein IT384_10155 [Deltaproteobacteria bacterium]|nr:hypothetical protein [Deltaproteobacteria bacterium]
MDPLSRSTPVSSPPGGAPFSAFRDALFALREAMYRTATRRDLELSDYEALRALLQRIPPDLSPIHLRRTGTVVEELIALASDVGLERQLLSDLRVMVPSGDRTGKSDVSRR